MSARVSKANPLLLHQQDQQWGIPAMVYLSSGASHIWVIPAVVYLSTGASHIWVIPAVGYHRCRLPLQLLHSVTPQHVSQSHRHQRCQGTPLQGHRQRVALSAGTGLGAAKPGAAKPGRVKPKLGHRPSPARESLHWHFCDAAGNGCPAVTCLIPLIQR